MKIQKKKSKAGGVEEQDSFEEAIANLLDVMSESIKDEYENKIEPYDRYVARLRMRFYQDAKTFSLRFKKGYLALIDEMKKPQ